MLITRFFIALSFLMVIFSMFNDSWLFLIISFVSIVAAFVSDFLEF